MFLEFAKPRDSELIGDVNAILSALNSGHYTRASCTDSAAAIELIGGAIKEESSRNLVLNVAGTMCLAQHGGGGIKSVSNVPSSLVTRVLGGASGPVPSASSTGQSSSGSSGSSGQSSSGSSGSSGQSSSGSSGAGSNPNASSSGTSGQSSGSSGESSGSSGQNTSSGSSGTSGTSGTSGSSGESSGSSGQSSSGTSGQ